MSLEGRCGAVVVDEQDSTAGRDLTDASKARKIWRTPKPVHTPTGNRDKQTVVVPAMKRHLQGVQFQLPGPAEKTRRDRNAWHALGFDAGTHPAGGAETGEIGREAVGDVHHRACGLGPGEPLAKLHRNLRVQMLPQHFSKSAPARQIRSHKVQAKLGAAQLSGNIYKVARTGT